MIERLALINGQFPVHLIGDGLGEDDERSRECQADSLTRPRSAQQHDPP
jgi:hypothetical protein